ncbi:uncharacterized protein LOC132273418 [Cornus florida]|uniref:uncharacterized protein LOC132273418 n=1 Tax=Cornus florida TaxID=4283 RepID=UPI0028A20CD6|nr:uncharacterized protein LOC132273418 [Cornus florida]
MLRLGNSRNMEAILTQVSIHCNDFVGLGISGPFIGLGAYIGEDEARVLVTLLPNIKYLDLRYASLKRENLVTILKGCKKFVFFDARDCEGYECDDEILNLASHIPTFMYEGSEEWFDDENFGFVYEFDGENFGFVYEFDDGILRFAHEFDDKIYAIGVAEYFVDNMAEVIDDISG